MWSVVWDCIFDSLKTIYTVMNTIKVFDINGAFSVSVWDISIGVIVMGAIINLFINFTVPTLPDRSSVSSVTTSTTGNRTKTTKSKTTTTRFN